MNTKPRMSRTAGLIALLVAATCMAQSRTMTSDDVARIRDVRQAEISPDGKHVAYTLGVPRIPMKDPDGGAWSELHVVDRDGNSRPFITGEVSVSSLSWSADGKDVIYRARRGKDAATCLYAIPIDGGESRKLLSHATSIGPYTMSPDGKRVAFLASDEGNARSKKIKGHGFDAEVYEENLTFTRVWIAELGSDEPARMLELEGQASEIAWSPVGDRLTVCLAPTPLIDDHYMSRKLHVVDIATGRVTARFDNPGKIGQVGWSADGAHVAFISAEDIHDPSEGRLMVAPASGGAFKDILAETAKNGQVAAFAWQNADDLLVLLDEGVTTQLLKVRRDGTGEKMLLAGTRPLHGLNLSADGMSAAMTSDAPDHPMEVFAMAHGDRAPKRLTNSNPWLSEIRFAKQEIVKHRARDGVELQGILIRPLDEKPGRRYPLVLAVHGGPEAHIQNGWLTRYSYPGQLGAARGIATFYPNYRGSTGRGVDFSKAGQADYGGKEFDDLIDAVDHLVASGLADKDKVGVTGGSYGGFASAWCATKHSERFAASVMFVGISNQISKAGTTDIPKEMFLVHARKRLWDDWQFYLERSPIYHVEKARTPILILHGKNDPRVHPGQSMELYRQLKILGKTPVRLVLYPGEGHGNRRAASRYDYNLRMMRWFEHYLKGQGGEPPPAELDYGKKP